jgi:hypothetical protein
MCRSRKHRHYLEQLRQEFSGSGIQYWVLPMIENGVI